MSTTPPRVTEVAPARLVPVSVTTVATPARETVGLYALTVGTVSVVDAVNDAIQGKDSIAVKAGTITVNAGGNGLRHRRRHRLL